MTNLAFRNVTVHSTVTNQSIVLLEHRCFARFVRTPLYRISDINKGSVKNDALFQIKCCIVPNSHTNPHINWAQRRTPRRAPRCPEKYVPQKGQPSQIARKSRVKLVSCSSSSSRSSPLVFLRAAGALGRKIPTKHIYISTKSALPARGEQVKCLVQRKIYYNGALILWDFPSNGAL